MPNTILTTDTTVARNEDILFSEVADGMSLMDIDSGKYFHFDQTGAQIWKNIDGTVQIGELCGKLQQDYEIESETCRNDTLEFLQELSSIGLVKIQD